MTTGQPQDRPDRLPVLDGLRGIAALTVVVGHSANAGFLPAGLGHGLGQVGVGVFFVLSGFLMAWLYALTPFTAETLRAYAAQRIGRVLPLYLLVVLIAAACLDVLPISPYRFTGPEDVLAALSLASGTGVLWSVPVEMHYYVLFVAIWFAAAKGHARLMLAGLFLTGAVLAVTLAAQGIGPRLLPFWLHFFLAGSAIGLWIAHDPQRLSHLASHPAAAALAWAVILAAPVASPAFRVMILGWDVSPTYMDPVTIAFPILILIAGLSGRGPFALLAAAPLRWLGTVSFGIYLLHPVIIRAVDAMPGLPAGFAFPLILSATVALAGLLFAGVERPAQSAVAGLARRPMRPLAA